MRTQRQADLDPARNVREPARLAEFEGDLGTVNGALLDFGSAAPEAWDYVPMPPVALDDDGYLMADAMPQNDRHLGRMLAYAPALKERYRGGGGMVGADLSMPYVQGSPGKTLAPDLFVALRAEEREGRSSYKLWEEPAPDFVLEDLSPNDWRRDTVDKRQLYRRLGVREYWMFDETARRLRDDAGRRLGVYLVGYRLRRGEYKRVRSNAAGRLPSRVLALELCVRDALVRFYDPVAGEYLPTYDEAQRHTETERQRAEEERRRADEERQRAEEERLRADAALARVAALEAELQARREAD